MSDPTYYDPSNYDEFGFYAPRPVDYPPRREPPADFPTGPSIGSALPAVCLPNQQGQLIDIRQHCGNRRAIVVFHRSAYW